MKCKHCNGTGTTNWCVNGTFVDCPYCGGTGEMEVEMTNDEWRRTCSAEEFAEKMVNLVKDDFKKLREYYWLIANDDKDALMMWLKEKHKESE